MLDLLTGLAVLGALGGLWLLARKMGWSIPGWVYGLVGGAVALLGFGRRMVKKPPAPPAPVSVEPVRRTAADILAEHAARDQKKIVEAVEGPTPQDALADLANARKRRE